MKILRRNRRELPGLDTTSTSDISFMLLIFFLVTTSMDSDKGLGRQLPPLDPEEQETLQDVDKSKILTLTLQADNSLVMEDKTVAIDASFRKQLRHFIIEKGGAHIIELQVSTKAEYDTYFRLQNQIVRAYRELREAAAQKQYGKSLADLDEEEKENITEQLPQRIQETVVY